MKKHYTDLPARNPRTVKAMRAFLADHFRYDTMNSWNGCTSYAVKIKISRLNLTAIERDRCYDLLGADDCMEESGFSMRLQEFDESTGWAFQIGTNGRSGGYAVLYEGGRKETGYKSYCRNCGQQNYTEANGDNRRCGKCGNESRVNYTYTHTTPYAMPGRGIDENGVDDMDNDDIRRRFRQVWAFDVAVEEAVANFVGFAMENETEEVTVMVPHKVTRVKREEGED